MSEFEEKAQIETITFRDPALKPERVSQRSWDDKVQMQSFYDKNYYFKMTKDAKNILQRIIELGDYDITKLQIFLMTSAAIYDYRGYFPVLDYGTFCPSVFFVFIFLFCFCVSVRKIATYIIAKRRKKSKTLETLKNTFNKHTNTKKMRNQNKNSLGTSR